MELKLITIDFWNTLFDSSGGLDRNKLRLKILVEETDKLGHFVKQKELTDAMKSSWEFFNRIWIDEQRTPSSIELSEYLWEALKLEHNRDAIDSISEQFSNSILVIPPKPVENVQNILPKMKENYKLAIVSDTGFSPGAILKELLEKHDLIKYFDSFSFSNETGYAKPHPKAFEKVLNDLDISADKSLHIGDIEKTDVIGAKSLGMGAIRFSGDTKSFIPKDNPKTTKADAEVFDWDKIPDVLREIQNRK